MAQEPDRIRDDIERTRAELTRDVDRLADKTSPTRVARRGWTSVKEKVMGTSTHAASTVQDKAANAASTVQDKAAYLGDKASNLGDRASSTAHDVAEGVKSAPQAVARQTEGNPIAAGIIAFGVGMLAATLIPASDAEKRAGQQLKDNMGDLQDRLGEVGRDIKDDVSGTVREAAQQVKETAQDAARTTGQEAKSSAKEAAETSRR